MKKFGLLLWLVMSLLLCTSVLAAGKGLRDPTRPLATAMRNTAAAASTRPAAVMVLPQLQLVLVGHERRHAVIDGELLAEGDAIHGLTLLRILDDAVVLTTPNGPRTLPLSLPVEQ